MLCNFQKYINLLLSLHKVVKSRECQSLSFFIVFITSNEYPTHLINHLIALNIDFLDVFLGE